MEMHEASRLFSYRWRVVYLFSEGFRIQDIATILHVGCTFLKKLIRLYRETSTVNYLHMMFMFMYDTVCLNTWMQERRKVGICFIVF